MKRAVGRRAPARAEIKPKPREVPTTGRDKLIHAGLKLFSESGYDGTSVRQLAAEADVSFGLIRKYFGSKEGLRDAIEEYVIGELQAFYSRSLPLDHRSPEAAAESAAEFFSQDNDVLLYLRFALLHPQKGTQKLIQRYFNMYQTLVSSLDEAGQLGEGVDRRWGAFLLMFMQLGPLVLEPFGEQLLGESMYSAKLLRERQKAYIHMLTNPLLIS